MRQKIKYPLVSLSQDQQIDDFMISCNSHLSDLNNQKLHFGVVNCLHPARDTSVYMISSSPRLYFFWNTYFCYTFAVTLLDYIIKSIVVSHHRGSAINRCLDRVLNFLIANRSYTKWSLRPLTSHRTNQIGRGWDLIFPAHPPLHFI